MSSSPPIVIIGAGLAGAACAFELTQAGRSNVLIVERCGGVGQHGTAQNAALIRSHASNPHTASLARQGARWWAQQRLTHFDACGSVLIGGRSGELMAGYRAVDHRWLSACQTYNLIGQPLPQGQKAFFNALDGIGQPQELLDALIQRSVDAGARLKLNCNAELQRDKLVLDGQVQAYDALVIAAGAWSRSLLDLPVQAFARHLFVDTQSESKSRPWVWDLDEELYWRQHPDGLLMSACDERVIHAPEPSSWPPQFADEIDHLNSKLARSWPGLLPLKIARQWSGLRVLTPDDGFVLGRDSRSDKVYWCSALGGHGVTCCVPAAQIAMHQLTNRPLNNEQQQLAAAHSVTRFATLAETWHS